MAGNTILTPSIIANEALMQFENNLVMGAMADRQYENQFKQIGDTITIKKPVRYTAADGPALKVQDITQGSTSLTVDTWKHVGFQITAKQMTMDIKDLGEEIIKPAMIPLAQAVESSLAGLYKKAYLHRGTPGTTPGSFSEIGAGGQALDEIAAPQDGRVTILNPAAGWKVADAVKGVYVQNMAQTALEKAKVMEYAGTTLYKAQTIPVHTVGAYGGTPLVNGASQATTYDSSKDTGTMSLVTDGWSTSVTGLLKAGDVITVAGVYSVNPQTKQSTGALANFVVVSDVNSDGSGNATLTISPPMITSGAYQTVTGAPADNAAITVKTGTASTAYPQNLMFPEKSFALVTAPIELPLGGGAKAARKVYKGISINTLIDFDTTTYTNIFRFDILYGVAMHYPENVVRITG